MKIYRLLFLALLATFAACQSPQKTEHETATAKPVSKSLQDAIEMIVSKSAADIGVAILGPNHDTILIHGNKPYRMQSVAKFPQALKLLKLVDEGKYPKDYRIKVSEQAMKQRTYSSLSKDHPTAPFDLSIRETLEYSIGQSDNITSNIIFDLDGGPKEVESFVHGLGIQDIGINVDYWHLNDSTSHYNWSTPLAMASLLELFYQGKVLNEENRNLLWDVMVKGPNGKNRIPGKLPENTQVGHKTGTGNTDDVIGRIMALNDVGIVELPDKRHFVIAVFMSDSFESEDRSAEIIADIAHEAYTHYAH
jgi:beta-lactamase class A